jgi:putative ABC transport system ATP-binding protein
MVIEEVEMALKIKNVTKSFNDKVILKNFSYEFPDKGIVAIIGESGIGKTTLLRLIAGLDKDYCGEILCGGSKNVSFAFQEYRLFDELTALENVVCAISSTKSEAVNSQAIELLQEVGFSTADMNLYPGALSGGMKQRISLCRAFMKKANILLLDEPTKELDRDNANKILDIITDISKERLVIIVTHSSNDLEYLSANLLQIPRL